MIFATVPQKSEVGGAALVASLFFANNDVAPAHTVLLAV